jgi:ribosome-binding factor A
MVDEARARKLADRIARIVAEMLERRVKDPRLGFVTVTEARLTNDLRDATVYYTVYGTEEEQAGTAAALASATGLIRSEVGRQTGLRHTPSLTFVKDTLPEGAQHLEELVARARAADEALAAAREGAQPAGDPDPYRTAPEPEADAGEGEEPETWPGHGPGEDDWEDRFRPGAGRGTPGEWADGGRRAARPPRGRSR